MIERLAAIISDMVDAAVAAIRGDRGQPELQPIPVRVRRDDRR